MYAYPSEIYPASICGLGTG